MGYPDKWITLANRLADIAKEKETEVERLKAQQKTRIAEIRQIYNSYSRTPNDDMKGLLTELRLFLQDCEGE